MCGGGSVKKALGKVTKVASLGLTDDPLEKATLGALKQEKGGGISAFGLDIIPGVPELPPLPETADPEVAKKEAADKAAREELARRRKIAAGGRQSTILAGGDFQRDQRKTLLGQ